MKSMLIGVTMMSAMNINTPSTSNIRDEAAIKTLVESVAILADSGQFEALEQHYAEEIQVDYTSLAGGEPELKSPQALMSQWAAVLPGFERTRHALSNIKVQLEGDHAIATADVVADHYLGEQHWQVSGHYRYRFIKDAGHWLISAAQFNLKNEVGSRDIFATAIEKAQVEPPSYLKRQVTIQTVQRFLKALEDHDMDTFNSLWADDAIQDMPYSPPGHPTRILGKANIVALYAQWPENSANANFTEQLKLYPMQDPETLFVEYQGRVDIVPTGRRYQQSYGGLFHVVNGKIQLFREYFDPAPFAWAFDLKP